MGLWKMIVMKLDIIEDMVSLSLLQKTFQEIEKDTTNK